MSKEDIITDVSSWKKTSDKRLGTNSGVWLRHPKTPDSYMFKELDDKQAFIECFVSDLGTLLKIPVAEYRLATYDNKHGVITKNFIPNHFKFINGVELLKDEYGWLYSKNRFKANNINYSVGIELDKVLNSLKEYDLDSSFIKILFLKCLVGDLDIKNLENWGILKNRKSELCKIAPTFDNSISLGYELNSYDIQNFQNNNSAYANYLNRDTGILINNKFASFSGIFEHIAQRYYAEAGKCCIKTDSTLTANRSIPMLIIITNTLYVNI